MVQRMTEVDRLQQVRDQRAAVAQQQFGLEMTADLERRETEVKGPPETMKAAVNPDARRERRPDRREGEPGRPRPEASQEEPEGQGGPGGAPGDPGRTLDIKI
jgi:hypothetical protein